MTANSPRPAKIRALISDIDGTLVRDDKTLPEANRLAAARLAERGIALALVSSRPPRGIAPLIRALGVSTVVAGFNGGVIATSTLELVEQHLLPPSLARQAVRLFADLGVETWVYSGQDWLIRDANGDRVAHETRTLGFAPTVVREFGDALDAAGKIVGVSENPAVLDRCQAELTGQLHGHASVVRSQTYYLDITHNLANKGAAVRAMARHLGTPIEQVAVIGDGANDVAMFEVAGFSIAMGNAEPAVQAAASAVTATNEAEGFAKAVDRFILTRQADTHR